MDKKGKFGQRDRHVEREDNVKTQGKDGHLQTKEPLRLPEARGKAWNNCPSQLTEGTNPATLVSLGSCDKVLQIGWLKKNGSLPLTVLEMHSQVPACLDAGITLFQVVDC